MLTDTGGTVTDTYDYDAWGNSVNTTGITPNNYLYRGEQYDSDLRLYYFRARYLNPLSGRFLTRDSAAVRVGKSATLNRYLYTQANPVNLIDPFGHSAIIEYLTPLRIGAITGLLLITNTIIYEIWCENNELRKLTGNKGHSAGAKIVGSADSNAPCGVLHEELPPSYSPGPGKPGWGPFPEPPEPIER